jgi:hypothetical protein
MLHPHRGLLKDLMEEDMVCPVCFPKKKIVEGSNVSALLLLPGGLFFFYYTTFTSVVFQNVMQLPVMTTAACALENGGDGFDVCVLLLENYKKYG